MTTVVWPHRVNPVLGRKLALPADDGRIGRFAIPGDVAAGGKTAVRNMRIVMAGGGTGGHLYPGLAVAGALEQLAATRGESVELIWAATPRTVDQRLLAGFGERYVPQKVQPLTKSVGKLLGFWRGWRESCGYWAEYFSREKVDLVVALGGYAAGPASYVAGKRGIPVVLLNPDALPGMANRFLMKRADLVVTQWPLAPAYQKAIRGKAKALGCPIRAELVQREREEGGKRLGIDWKMRTLVVTGASLGAKTINDAMIALLEDAEVRRAFEELPIADCRSPIETAAASSIGNGQSAMCNPLPPRWQIVHLAGVDQAAEVRAAYAKFPQVRVKVMDYCDDMASVWSVADLAIARAGASTCAELTACGVPSLLLPYPYHKDMHQRANAEELAREGAAFIIEDAKEARVNAEAIKMALETLLFDDDERGRMAEAARVIGKPEAAARIADEIVALIASSSR